MTNTKEINILTFADVLEMQRKVVQWNKLFGINPTDKEYIPLYKSLSDEEFFGDSEFLESWNKKCEEGQLDGAADLSFTTFQWAVLDDNCIDPADECWFEGIGADSDITPYIEGLGKELERGDSFASQTELLHILKRLSTKYNVKAAFDRVCESNYSKAVHKDKNVDIRAEIDYITSKGRYADITAEESGDYIIFKAGMDVESGVVFDKKKVIKSRQFVDIPELGGLLEFKY